MGVGNHEPAAGRVVYVGLRCHAMQAKNCEVVERYSI